MPRTTKPAKASTSTVEEVQEESSAHGESSSSDQEQESEVFLQPSQAQGVPNMFMPYIEDPMMDWAVNDGQYHRFLKWHLKCEHFLECELAMLPEKGNARESLLGVVILAWTSTFCGACPLMN